MVNEQLPIPPPFRWIECADRAGLTEVHETYEEKGLYWFWVLGTPPILFGMICDCKNGPKTALFVESIEAKEVSGGGDNALLLFIRENPCESVAVFSFFATDSHGFSRILQAFAL